MEGDVLSRIIVVTETKVGWLPKATKLFFPEEHPPNNGLPRRTTSEYYHKIQYYTMFNRQMSKSVVVFS